MGLVSFTDMAGNYDESALDSEAIESADPSECAYRASASADGSCICALIAGETMSDAGFDLAGCKKCIAAGLPNIETNEFIRAHIGYVLYNQLVANAMAYEPKAPSTDEVQNAVTKIKGVYGNVFVTEFINRLVYEESITSEAAAALVALHEL